MLSSSTIGSDRVVVVVVVVVVDGDVDGSVGVVG
jgi:hypothetical protein